MMHASDESAYSTLEVYDSRLPESRNNADELPEAISPEKSAFPPPTICGLHKRTFWMIFAVAITLVVVGAVLGGTVGGRQAANSNSTTLSNSSSSSSNSTSPSSNNSAPAPTVLLSKPKLASLNYTDSHDVAHYRVYFQVSTKAIYQSAWNSSVQTWVVSPVTTSEKLIDSSTNLDVKEHTPIVADVYWHSASQIDFHLYFLDSQNRIQELFSTSADGPWSSGTMSNRYTAGDSSQLAAYGRHCPYCLDVKIVIYQDASNALQLCQSLESGWTQTPIGSGLATPVAGSALSIAPVWAPAELVLYSNSGILEEFHWNGSLWRTSETEKLQVLSLSASIAVFSYGWDATSNRNIDLQALVTNPDSKSGGVNVDTWNVRTGWSNPNNSSALSPIANYSTIAANLAGRVYGVVESSAGSRIVEWAFDHSGVYTRIGNVTTNPL